MAKSVNHCTAIQDPLSRSWSTSRGEAFPFLAKRYHTGLLFLPTWLAFCDASCKAQRQPL